MSIKWLNHKSNSGTVFKNLFHFFNCKKWKQKILVDKTMFCQNHNRLWQIFPAKKRLFLKRRYYVFLEPAKLSCLSWIFYWSHRIFGWAVRFLHEVGIILVIEHCQFQKRKVNNLCIVCKIFGEKFKLKKGDFGKEALNCQKNVPDFLYSKSMCMHNCMHNFEYLCNRGKY